MRGSARCARRTVLQREIFSEDPGIEDMAPTALDLFGIKPPPYMEGKPLMSQRPKAVENDVAA